MVLPACVLLAVLGLFGLVPGLAAAAGFETVGNFAPKTATAPNPPQWPEDVQLGGVSGMAINVGGAGGVAPGTLYAAGFSLEGWRVARYSPDGDFELAWSDGLLCGPAVSGTPVCPAVADGSGAGIDVEVDQATGNVYVFLKRESPNVVREYSPDASTLITSFGESDPTGTIATSPGKFHNSFGVGDIAVNNEGEVYVFDEDKTFHHRLMVFAPESPGDYEHYEFTGELGAGPLGSHEPRTPVLDEAGNIYVASEGFIEEYDPAAPATPICSFELKAGGITSMTVNPATREPFYYSTKNRKIHQLSSCAGGKFLDTGIEFSVVPQRGNIEAMVVNPTLHCGPAVFDEPVCEEERPEGVLYAATPTNVPGTGSGGEPGQSALGYILAPPVSHLPVIESESVAEVGQTSVKLNALVNPRGSPTTFVFQYISGAAYRANEPTERFAGAIEAPLGGGALGSGQGGVLAAVTISGLLADSEYHYRVVATSGEGPAGGAAEAFRTFAASGAGLPDTRAYELVSPPQKNGGEVLPASPITASCGTECKPGLTAHPFPLQFSSQGEGQIAYQGSPFDFAAGASEFDEYISRRTPAGWQTSSLSPPLVGDFGGAGFRSFDLDATLARGIVSSRNPALTPQAPAGYENLFAQSSADPSSLTPLLTSAPPNRPSTGVDSFVVNYVGASRDGSRVFFEANDALTGATESAPAAVDGGPTNFNLYEYELASGQLRLVNVQPVNAQTAPGAAFGAGFQLAKALPPATDYSNAISSDGLRVYWSSASGQVYLRENGESTLEIPDAGKFLTAADDGSKVLLSNGHLYDLETEAVTDLTEGQAGFQGLVGQSNDLSSVYFVDTAALTAEPREGCLSELDPTELEEEESTKEGRCRAQAGQNNLYAWRESALRFVATLLPGDNADLGVWEAAPVRRSAEASPNGRWLAFGSKGELTGVDGVGACEYNTHLERYVGSVPCEEVFLYDSGTGSLRCPSCNPVGAHPLGGSFLRLTMSAPGSLSQDRYLADNGRVYFDSRDALSARDTNNGVEDVYQFEPGGLGTCASPGGCVSLISSGRGASDSNFMTIDESGQNVFFTTREQLVPADRDGLIDLYDARVGGGMAAESEVATPPCQGQGENCLASPPAPPVNPIPSSMGFEGPGNVKPKQKQHKKKQHKKKHKKKHKAKNQKHMKANRGGSK